jgi:hypothetical protein
MEFAREKNFLLADYCPSWIELYCFYSQSDDITRSITRIGDRISIPQK